MSDGVDLSFGIGSTIGFVGDFLGWGAVKDFCYKVGPRQGAVHP